MEKNWLIRTKSNHILGPISKDKVLELFNNGSIKPDDEICSGNGFWFFIREDDLVKRYLLGDEPQGFNPISEAKNVLTQAAPKLSEVENRDEITQIGKVDLSKLNEDVKETTPQEIVPAARLEINKPIQSSEKPETKKKIKTEIESSKKNKVSAKQNFIKYLTWLGIILFILLIYYRKTVIRSFIQTGSFQIISPVIAQEVESKKKT